MQKSYLQFQSLVLAARKRPNDCQARDPNPNIAPEVFIYFQMDIQPYLNPDIYSTNSYSNFRA